MNKDAQTQATPGVNQQILEAKAALKAVEKQAALAKRTAKQTKAALKSAKKRAKLAKKAAKQAKADLVAAQETLTALMNPPRKKPSPKAKKPAQPAKARPKPARQKLAPAKPAKKRASISAPSETTPTKIEPGLPKPAPEPAEANPVAAVTAGQPSTPPAS